MSDDVIKRTSETAALYFKGVSGEKPCDLWKTFDRGLWCTLAMKLEPFGTGVPLVLTHDYSALEPKAGTAGKARILP